jgi:SsrA-binding protein
MITIAANKKANFDYFIKEKYESGIILTGSEVKSLRINTGSIKESYVS